MKKLLLLISAFSFPLSAFSQTSVTVDANGNVRNGKPINFATGKLEVNGVAVSGGGSGGLVIGTNVQAWDPDLDALAALGGTNTIYYRSAANTWSAVTIGSNLSFSGGTLDANASAYNILADSNWTGLGDLIVGTGIGTASVLNVGLDGRMLMSDSGQPTGIKWATSGQVMSALGLTALATTTPASGVATFLATPTLVNLKAAVTDETTVGWNLLTLANPSAISFLQLNANNTVTAQSASAQRTALGLAIGTNVQAWDADLDTWATITPGTGVGTALGTNVGSAGAFITNGGALGTPSSGSAANLTSFPTLNQNTTGSAASLSISGQTGLLTFTGLASTSRAKTVRDAADTILELGGSYTPTGTWTNLTLVTPALGTPSALVLTNATGSPTGISLTLAQLSTIISDDDVPGLAAANTFTGANINSKSGAASVPAMKYSGVPFAGTGTTSFPLLYLNDANATASTALSTGGTYLGVNAHGSTDLMHLMTDGTSKFKVTSGGTLTAADALTLGTNLTVGAGNFITFNGRSIIDSGGANGIIRLTNSGGSAFTRLIFAVTSNSGAGIGFDAVNGITLQSAAGTATWNDGSTANSGTVANRYLFGIAAPTLTATGTSVTDTVASTFYIGGAPTASTNTTITTPYALNVAAGVSNFGGPLVAAASYTVATLPSTAATGKVTGSHATVTDGDASLAWGATVVNSGAGATQYLVWYNGTAWTVLGK